jgi:hypothetical protein
LTIISGPIPAASPMVIPIVGFVSGMRNNTIDRRSVKAPAPSHEGVSESSGFCSVVDRQKLEL